MIYYAQLNVISVLVCLIIQLKEFKDKQEIFESRSFRNILLIMEAILLLDTASLFIQNDVIPHTHLVHLMIMNGYFILQSLFPLELLIYVIGRENIRSFKMRALLSIPFILSVIIIIVNSFRPFAFDIVENDRYERMSSSGFFFIILWPIFYVFCGVIFLARNYSASAGTKRENYGYIIIFALIGFIAGIVSFISRGFLLWPLIAIDLIYLYINVLSKSNQKLDILAFKDSLTGVGNAALYASVSGHIKESIDAGTAEFALVVMDANGLKYINDNYGHEAGNKFIITCAKFICRIFDHSPIFRIGGDEFVTILEKTDFEEREELLRRFDEEMLNEKVVSGELEIDLSIARGIAVYTKGMTFDEVFYKADSEMYINKSEVKKKFNIPSREDD